MTSFKKLLQEESWSRMDLPADFELKELENPLAPFQKNVNQYLSTFNLSSEQDSPKTIDTGSAPQVKVYFSQNDPFITLPLLLLNQGELPWDRVKKQMVAEIQGLTRSEEKKSARPIGQSRPLPSKQDQFMQKELDSDDVDDMYYDEEAMMYDSDDANFQMDMQESGFSQARSLSFRPFQDEAGASKRLKNYQLSSFINKSQDQVLTPSSLHVVQIILPRALKLMMLSRGNYAFDLFLQLTHVIQVYLFTVLCMFSTCHPSSYDEESRKRLERFSQ